MKGKQATVQKMHHAGMHYPLCVYFCSVLLYILITCSLEQRLYLCFLCDAWLIAVYLGNAKNRKGVCVHCCHGHSQVYRLYGGSISNQSAQFLSP